MLKHKHNYVPILKTKAGEMWSLRNLQPTVKAQMTPLLEMHKPDKRKDKTQKPLDKHIEDVCEAIKKACGTSNVFFLDTEWINNIHGTAAAITMSLSTCRAIGLKPIPVVKINYDDQSLQAVKSAIEFDRRGCMLRLDFEDVAAQAAIRGVLECLGLHESDVHLLLDYRENPMNLGEDVQKVTSIQQWGAFTAGSGAFPKTISTLPQKTWVDIPRHDWNTWEQSTKGGALPRNPTFSDYATRCPGAPPGGGDPHVHLRYTTERKWLLHLDGTLHDGKAENMPWICRQLIGHTEFNGREFSEGDKEIHGIAYQGEVAKEETGGTTQWVQWGVNHHLTFVVRQLQSHASL